MTSGGRTNPGQEPRLEPTQVRRDLGRLRENRVRRILDLVDRFQRGFPFRGAPLVLAGQLLLAARRALDQRRLARQVR